VLEAHRRQSALAHLGLAARADDAGGEAGIRLAERPAPGLLSLRGDSDAEAFLAAARDGLGFDLPTTPNSTAGLAAVKALWLGPSEWLLVSAEPVAALAAALSAALDKRHYALNDVSDSRTVLLLAGPRARDLLAKACSLDLHASVFGPGDCAQSSLARVPMLLHQLAEDPDAGPTYEIYVHRSLADYAWRWLEVAAAEYGFRVAAAETLMGGS
jgi:sarcosine oxidase subunit gamma